MPPETRADRKRLSDLLSGAAVEDPTGAWQAYIRAFHDEVEPGRIATIFRTGDGRSSYDVLVDALVKQTPAAGAILEIGCGDGSLARRLNLALPSASISAIDTSQALLRVGRRKNASPQIDYLAATATDLPFGDASFDAVSAHLVLMLVEPLERALQETRRVLREQGRCFFVVDRSSEATGEYAALRNIGLRFLRESWPYSLEPQLGDPRAKSRHQFMELMMSAGLGTGLATEDFEISARLYPRNVWRLFSLMYVFGSLEHDYETELERRIAAHALDRTDADGRITLSIPLRLVVGGR